MDFFDKIENILKSRMPEIKRNIEEVSSRDFQNLCYKARATYNKYSKNPKYANILYKLYSIFEVYFEEMNKLPISVPSDKFASEEVKREYEIKLNIYTLLDVFFEGLEDYNLLRPEMKEKETINDFISTFFDFFKDKNFAFEPKVVRDYLANIVLMNKSL